MDIRTVRVRAGDGYDVMIGRGLLDECGKLLQSVWAGRVCAVITDTNVAPLYLERAIASLEREGIRARGYAFPAGERSKTLDTLGGALEFLASEKLTRADLVIALGGGVVGDLAGFAAGCYMRGVAYAQMPTTLLSCVDSSVGGKTAVDLKAGKNLAGLFYQPRRVIADADCLGTLHPGEYACGAAEAIKMGVLSNPALFEIFERGEAKAREEDVIRMCVEDKAKVVEADERDTGLRETLNLGHTYAHAIEKLSEYRIPHGRAVGVGLAMAARAAVRMGDMKGAGARRIIETLRINGLSFACPYPAEDIADAALSDKKRAGGHLRVIVPFEIGRCEAREIECARFVEYARAGTGEL